MDELHWILVEIRESLTLYDIPIEIVLQGTMRGAKAVLICPYGTLDKVNRAIEMLHAMEANHA